MTSSSPNIVEIFRRLNQHEIKYVLVGSVAAMVYGAEVEPGDLDITPALDLDNLSRLAAFLQEIEAFLPETDDVGHWEEQEDGEKKWVSVKPTPEVLEERRNWQPDPNDLSTFDHLFHSNLGNFDITPQIAKAYATLIIRAKQITYQGQLVWVAHIDDLLATLTVPRRKKDAARVRQLRQLQQEINS